MTSKIKKGVYLKEEMDFIPDIEKNKSKSKGEKNGKKKKKGNGEDIS